MIRHGQRYPPQWVKNHLPMQAVEIDLSHPMANALAAMFVPGSPWVGMTDLAGNCLPLVPDSAALMAMTAGGPGWNSTPATATCGLQALAPAVLTITTPQTLVWFGETRQFASTNNCSITGISPNNTQSAPYFSRNITTVSGGVGLSDSVQNFGCFVTNTAIPVGMTSLIGTFNGATQTFYVNGVQLGTTATGGTPTYAATACISIGDSPGGAAGSNMTTVSAAWYNRQLTLSEIEWLAAEPFSMLRPKARRAAKTPLSISLPAYLRQPQIQIWDH